MNDIRFSTMKKLIHKSARVQSLPERLQKPSRPIKLDLILPQTNIVEEVQCFRIGLLLVGEGGFEPPKSSTTDLQSAPFGHSGTLPYSLHRQERMELVDGLEPPTC